MQGLKFSVIVAAYNVQGYLRQAVESVASSLDAEVIIVDDRSTDDTSALADELEASHANVVVVRPPTNAGLGQARNLGMSRATGEYVLFLDGDDYFAPDALARISGAVDQHAPDIVMFGYARLYPNGKAEEGIIRQPLQGAQPFTALERPDIYTVLNVAWNKAYRREFLEAVGLTFPTGYYEDIPWTYPLLAAATSIVGIDEPLYLYRQRWSGSILRSTDVRHLEILDQFNRLMEILSGMELDRDQHRAIFDCAFRNLSTLLTHQRHRIPVQHRQDFFVAVQTAVHRAAPADYAPPSSGHQAREMAWIWSFSYARFRRELNMRVAARRVRTRGRQLLRTGRGLVRRGDQRRMALRASQRVSPIDPQLAVFENLWGRSPRLNCLAVARELKASHPDMRIAWLVREGEQAGVPEGMETVIHGSRRHFQVLAAGKYFFVDANLPGWWKKRPGQVVTQLYHGTPIKLMGIEERGKSASWKDGLLRRCSQWDYSVVANPYSAEVWKHSYPVRCETLEVGYPRNDVLVTSDQDSTQAARSRLGVGDADRVILYMPTFRPGVNGLNPGNPSVAELVAVLEPGDVLLTRGHYFNAVQDAGAHVTSSDGRVVDVSDYAEVADLYLAADLLVSDFSSAIFDYAVLRRPIVIYAPDWQEYRDVRGTYFDITVDSPGDVARTETELAEIVSSRSYASPEAKARLARFADYFTAFESGHAAHDVIARVVDGAEVPRADHATSPFVTTWNMDRTG